MLLFKDRNNEMASEPARGDGSRTRKFFEQRSLLTCQLPPPAACWLFGSSCSRQMGTWDHGVWTCWAFCWLPGGRSSARGTAGLEHDTVQGKRASQTHGGFYVLSPFVPSVAQRCLVGLQQFAPRPAAAGYSPGGGGCPTCTMILSLEAASWASFTQRFTTS